ncbi:MAG: hypothetical protein EU530_10100 [Promethearchaeota archaeon]|nr:MAG: hypothetical protein EU530_10100 [Candidatus Lokiarchaeota archaeon]
MDAVELARLGLFGLFGLFGITDNPPQLVGLDNLDKTRNSINQVISNGFNPRLNPPPKLVHVPLKNGKNVIILEITPNHDLVYGLRLGSNPSDKRFYHYEFWKRIPGGKQQMDILMLNKMIKSRYEHIEIVGMKKLFRHLTKYSSLMGHMFRSSQKPKGPLYYYEFTVMNKSEKSIAIEQYGFQSPDFSFTFTDDNFPKILKTGEAFTFHFSETKIISDFLSLPDFRLDQNTMKITGWIKSANDQYYFSQPMVLSLESFE